MEKLLKRPTDLYDPAWVEFRKQNPGLRLSLSAGDPADGAPPAGDPPAGDPPAGIPPAAIGPDLSFLPESFNGEDGALNVDAFKEHYGELASFKSQADEAKAALPEGPDGYAWAVADDFTWAEGFNAADHQVPVLGEDGQTLMGEDGKPQTRDMTAADMMDPNDPDLALLQSALHEHGANPALMGKLAGIMANREVRGLIEAGKTAAAEKLALGPDAQSRMDVVERSLAARLPAAQAAAIFQDITSADGLRAVEALIKSGKTTPSPAPGGMDLNGMSNGELIAAGMKQQLKG